MATVVMRASGNSTGAGFMPLWLLGAAIFIVINTLLATSAIAQESEGDSCMIQDGSSGVCSLIEDCPWYWYNENFVKKRLESGVRCSWKALETEIICCKSNTVGSRASAACRQWPRKSLEHLIVGGVEAEEGEFPFMAALGYETEDESKDYEFRCGASLISRNFLLTAAHCVKGMSPVVAVLGTIDLAQPYEREEIKKIYPHDSYTGGIRRHNDIALIELRQEVTGDPSLVNPICLYMVGSDLPSSEALTTIGFGVTDSAVLKPPKVLMKVDVFTVALSQCIRTLRENQITRPLVTTQYCALGRENTVTGVAGDTCNGDSGGPLIVKVAGSPRLVGVTSHGFGCGGNFPGVYTRVASYIEWIESIVWPN